MKSTYVQFVNLSITRTRILTKLAIGKSKHFVIGYHIGGILNLSMINSVKSSTSKQRHF